MDESRLAESLGRVIDLVAEMTEDGISAKDIFGALSQQAAEVLVSQSFTVQQRRPMVARVSKLMLRTNRSAGA